ncbi:MAG: DNA-3-methyladenine glycosylase family protein [Arenicellales bacterium]|jgi:3-methyladenine DNA glycosylase/8-oxoguanine DNA glycosylase|nr:DNA-3-methyladenine glycosylase 2 family protein [Gammaproteobacteria bacterium]NDA14576.1 DNA-3-methyladenine glycosylase 2 family protein [Gammaproteobacteria bacterium]NDG44030.1 DNA-3-methyladenine glycosylase 2 family protein [Gammaproteobacteria bacterium]
MTDLVNAQQHLVAVDRGLARVIKAVGICGLESRDRGTVFEYLARSIVYQQLSGKAAATIHARLADLFPRRRIDSKRLLDLSSTTLRSAGLSRSKGLALADLARHDLAGALPSRRRLNAMSDAEIVECLTEVRGVGEWTVQMLLIFYLGRPDVLPIRDLGVLKGYQKMRGLAELPPPARLERAGLRWRPFRSAATWYLWRCLEVNLPRR